MAYENNHYVPQFILKRFGHKINRYNLKTGELKIKGSVLNAFSKKNIYPEWLEIMLSELESKFASLIDKKILKASETVTLNGDEIWLIKKFLTIATLRVPTTDFFNDRHIESEKDLKNHGFKEVNIPGESSLDYAYRTMKVVLRASRLEDVYHDPEVTYEACKWATLYHFCYLSIWDSSKCNEDFIITDNGMNCEHDKARFITFYDLGEKDSSNGKNDEKLKLSYIITHLYEIDKCNEELLSIYWKVLYKMQFVYANYYLFAVSSKRTIALINPFFRLYYDKNILEKTKHEPDIWPTLLSKEAMSSNTCTYMKKGEFSAEDEYHYSIKDLCLEDVIIVNCMSLDRISEWLGFDDSARIIRSLNTYNLIPYEYRRNHYDELIKKLYEIGYDFSNNEKYRKIKDKLVNHAFTFKERIYLKFLINFMEKGL